MSVAAFRNELKYQVLLLPVSYILKFFFLSPRCKQRAHIVLDSIRIYVVCKYSRNRHQKKGFIHSKCHKTSTCEVFSVLLLIFLDADPSDEIDLEREETICNTERGSASDTPCACPNRWFGKC